MGLGEGNMAFQRTCCRFEQHTARCFRECIQVVVRSPLAHAVLLYPFIIQDFGCVRCKF